MTVTSTLVLQVAYARLYNTFTNPFFLLFLLFTGFQHTLLAHNSSSTATANAPVIEVWYGDTQEHGNNGESQVWCNILGNVSDSDGGSITNLEYALNGGTPVTLTIGGDGRRLENSGDFNVDLAVSDLNSGTNTVVISATDDSGNTASKTVTINYTPNNVWSNPYSVDWGALNDITEVNDVAHVVDGKWDLTLDGIRTEEPGYDRLIAIGDQTWTNYEVLVPFTIHNMPGGGGVGVLLRWKGHTDTPVTCPQPKCGWLPLGDIAWYRPGELEFYEGPSTPRSLTNGVTYLLRTQVETDQAGNTYYKMRVWEQGTTEPGAWDLEHTTGLSDEQDGSFLLIAHKADVTFGDVTVTPGSLTINNIGVQLGNNDTEATITWNTNQDADSRIDYGTDCTYTLGFEEDATLKSQHSLTLTGLQPNTIYRYKITSMNTSGTAETQCLTFSTFSSGIVSDDFCDGVLNPVWTFDDPLNDGSYTFTGSGTNDAWLEIAVPAGTEHQVYTSGIQAPNLLQPMADADFEVEVKFESPVNTPQYQEQGILVKENDNRYLRFEFFSKDPGDTYIYAQGFDLPNNTGPFINTDISASGTAPLYMRVKRVGNQWTQTYSFDGATWMQGASFTYALTPTAIGPYAGNAVGNSSPAHTAQIDYFVNLDDPIANEDGCIASQPPVLAAIGNQVVEEGNSSTVTISATDPDGDDMLISFTESGLPGFAVLIDNNNGTATLQIDPLANDVGTYPVTVTATDEQGLTDSETFDIIITIPGAGPTGLLSDDFCDGVLGSQWTFVSSDPQGNYSFTGSATIDAWVEIAVPGGSAHELWESGIEAPHLLQSANDVDMELIVKMESPVNAPQYEEQGLLIKQDDFNFLRFEIYSSNSATNIIAAILSGSGIPLNSNITINANTNLGLGFAPIWMRVIRSGDEWTQSFSTDGTTWTDAGTFTHALNVTGVGIYGGNAGANSAFTAKFDYFESADDPIINEDAQVTNTTQNLTYCYIQDAIDAANSGDVITVGAGTYDETINIDKPLILNGANADTDCSSRGAESSIAPSLGSGAVVTISASNVTLNGFEITGPGNRYGINVDNASNTDIKYNSITDIGTTFSGGNVYGIISQIPNSPASLGDLFINNNCIDGVNNMMNTGYSAGGIGILQSTTTGTLTGLEINNNTISNVVSRTDPWPDGKIAYGIIINVAGGSGFEASTGKVVNANITGNDISGLEGFIATGIGLEGNTENATVTGNTVTGLTAYKSSDRAGGGLDLNGLKFENNKFVGTVTVENNSFDVPTFTHDGTPNLGYAIANYVDESISGAAMATCNWLGTAVASEIEDNPALDGTIFNKTGAETIYDPWLATNDIDNPDCSGTSCPDTPPTGLMTMNIMDNSADLSWDAVVGAGSYEVWSSIEGFVNVGNNTTYVLENLDPGFSYSWNVRAICSAGGISGWGNRQDFMTTGIGCADTPPSGTSTNPITSTSAGLNWNSVSGAVSYEVWNSVEGFVNVGNVINYTLDNLNEGTFYSWNVRAICDDGNITDWAGRVDFKTLGAGCTDTPPSNLSTNASPTSADLSWGPVSGASSYIVWSTAEGFVNVGNVTSYTLSDLSPGTDYSWNVKAVCAESGASDWGIRQDFTTPSSLDEPGDDVVFHSNDSQAQSAETFVAAEVLVYPNPARTFVTIKGQNEAIINRIVLYDLTGRPIQQVDRIEVNKYELILNSPLPRGLYLLRIDGEGFSTTKQLGIIQ